MNLNDQALASDPPSIFHFKSGAWKWGFGNRDFSSKNLLADIREHEETLQQTVEIASVANIFQPDRSKVVLVPKPLK